MKIFKIEPSEKEVRQSIIAYLDLNKIMWWPQQSGVATYKDKNKGERFVRYGFQGISDLACLINGRYVCIEIKKPSAYEFVMKHYDRIKSGDCKTKRDWHIFHQVGFIENVINHNGIGFFASSVDHVIAEFTKHGLKE